jgi:hypothetical protein
MMRDWEDREPPTGLNPGEIILLVLFVVVLAAEGIMWVSDLVRHA